MLDQSHAQDDDVNLECLYDASTESSALRQHASIHEFVDAIMALSSRATPKGHIDSSSCRA